MLSLATFGEGLSSCSVFYALDPSNHSLIFASDEETEHIQNIMRNNFVAGTIALETKVVGRIKGLQIKGSVQKCITTEEENWYYDRFPYAKVMKPILWKLKFESIKMTDNTLGFGKKLFWSLS